MKRYIFLLALVAICIPAVHAQYVLLNEDFGANGSFASADPVSVDNYDLDPVATYLSSEVVSINYYGQGNTSEGKYEGASGDNFFSISNNWNQSGSVLTWANMDVSAYSQLDDILFGCAFSGGPNGAWTGNWLFNLEYSFDDVAADPENATWQNIDLISNASGWPDPEVAGGDNWSLVTVDTDINLLGQDLLSVRIKSNGTFDYHFDDLKLMVKTPTSGGERVVIGKESFGNQSFYRGPASAYENYSNGGAFTFNDYQVHYQNYGNEITNSYAGNTNDNNWWITSQDGDGVPEDTLLFSVNTEMYADAQLQFGFTYWGGVPSDMVGVYYSADGGNWIPVLTVSPDYAYPAQGEGAISSGTFSLIRYDDLLPRAADLRIKIYQKGAGQFILDDLAVTGVFSELSTDATLSGITFPDDPDLTLEPAFSSEITEYEVLLPFGTMDPPAVQAEVNDEAAEYLIEDALDVNSGDEANRQTYILVTAGDGETTELYTITFAVDPEDPNVGIHEDRLSFSAYPVPAEDVLVIDGPAEPLFVRIVDITGRACLEQELTGVNHVDVSALTTGIYFLEVRSGKETGMMRFVKK